MRRLNVFGVAEQKSRDARCSSPLPHPPVPSTHPLSQPPGPSESASPGGHLEALTFQARARACVCCAPDAGSGSTGTRDQETTQGGSTS